MYDDVEEDEEEDAMNTEWLDDLERDSQSEEDGEEEVDRIGTVSKRCNESCSLGGVNRAERSVLQPPTIDDEGLKIEYGFSRYGEWMSEGGVGPDVTNCFWNEMARVTAGERLWARDDGATDGIILVWYLIGSE